MKTSLKNSSALSAVGITERHQVVRLIGESDVGGTPDTTASQFLIDAGFVAERGHKPELAHRGAEPSSNNFFLDLTITPGKRKEGSFKLIRVQNGSDIPIETGVMYDLDRTLAYLIISGHGDHLVYTQIIVGLSSVDKKKAIVPLPPLPSLPPPLPLPPPAPVFAPAQLAVEIRLEEIEPWQEQPRAYFRERPLVELAESMGGLVQVQPILVRPFQPEEARLKPASKYQIVDGERRWRGAGLNKAEIIKAIIVHPKDIVEQHRMSVIANMHREKHSHYEYARAVIFQYDHDRSAVQIAADFSKTPAWVYAYLGLKTLVSELFELLNPAVDREKQLSFRQAKILARVKKESQLAVWEQAKREGKAHGRRGILLRLQELAEENLSEEAGLSGRKRPQGPDHVVRPVNRAIAAVGFNARLMLEMAAKFKKSPLMAEPAARAAVAEQVKAAAEALLAFARGIAG